MTAFLLWALLIAGVLILLIPLINNILTTETIDFLNTMLNNLEYFVGSKNLNIFLCIMWLIIIIIAIRFFTRFFHVNEH